MAAFAAPPTRERIVRVAVVVKLKEALEPLHELEVVLVFAADQELNGDFFGHAYFTKAVLDDLMEGRGKGEGSTCTRPVEGQAARCLSRGPES